MTWARLAFAVLTCTLGAALARADERTISLRGGETADVGTAYWVVNCRSILKGDPTIDIMETPPGASVTMRLEKIVPRGSNCSRPVPGGTLVVAADKDIKSRVEGRLTVRVNLTTLDGKRQSTREMNLVLFPAGNATSATTVNEGAKP